jgi:hypothetical protein
VHQSKNLREWRNKIGYEMGFSWARVSTMAKTSLVENFKHGWRIDMIVNMATFFITGVLLGMSTWPKLQDLGRPLEDVGCNHEN